MNQYPLIYFLSQSFADYHPTGIQIVCARFAEFVNIGLFAFLRGIYASL